jgi:hypothetical protein
MISQNGGKPDRDRINTGEPYELRDWAKKFKTNPGEVKQAVKAVASVR